MAEAVEPPKVKLICGMIFARPDWFDRAAERLIAACGPTDIVSEAMDFNFTHYYDRQMGHPLYRRFLAFQRLIRPDELTRTKCLTNEIEADFAKEITNGACHDAAARPARPINLDPGYVAPSKVVLASMKNFSHRIYLGRGVYGEVTLMFHKGAWKSLPWTFPDFASPRYHPFLTAARESLRQQTSQKHSQESPA